MVNGMVTGTPFTIVPGHLYTLRLHLHCPETERVKQTYYAMVDGVVDQFGSGLVVAPAALVFEVRDLASASNTPVTVLYDGAVASSPAQANVVAVNSIQFWQPLDAAIGEVARILRPSGAFVAVTHDWAIEKKSLITEWVEMLFELLLTHGFSSSSHRTESFRSGTGLVVRASV